MKLNPNFLFKILTGLTVLGFLILCQFTGKFNRISSQLLTFITGAVTYILLEIMPGLKEFKLSAQDKISIYIKGIVIYAIIITICISEYQNIRVSQVWYGFLGVVGAFLYGSGDKT